MITWFKQFTGIKVEIVTLINIKIFWYFSIHTDVIELRRSDLVLVDKKKMTCQIGNYVILGDHRIKTKETEIIEKYQDLANELRKLWNVKLKVTPFFVRVLGTIPNKLGKSLKDTARIL